MEFGEKSIERKKILSILPPTQGLEGSLYNSKLYSSDDDGEDWLFSGLEGLTGIVVDYQLKTKYISIFHFTSYSKIFQYELYNGFENCFEDLAPDFRSFEIDSGFIGLQFDKPESAKKFSELVKGLKNKKNIFVRKDQVADQNEKENKFREYCKILKSKFCQKEDKKYDENYAEDGMLIQNHKNFKILNNISYSKKTKKFKFGKISKELKDLFLSFGIKKKKLEKDVDFAFDLFKKFIVGLGKNVKLKNRAVNKINHSFMRPEEKEELRKKEEAELVKVKRLTRVKKKKEKSMMIKNRGGKGTPSQPSTKNSSSTYSKSKKANREEESTEPVEEENLKSEKKELATNENNMLMRILSETIQNRRRLLKLHEEETEEDDDEDDEKQDDDW